MQHYLQKILVKISFPLTTNNSKSVSILYLDVVDHLKVWELIRVSRAENYVSILLKYNQSGRKWRGRKGMKLVSAHTFVSQFQPGSWLWHCGIGETKTLDHWEQAKYKNHVILSNPFQIIHSFNIRSGRTDYSKQSWAWA